MENKERTGRKSNQWVQITVMPEYNKSSTGAVWMETVRVQIRFVTKEPDAEEDWEGKVVQKFNEEIGSIFILNSWPHCFLCYQLSSSLGLIFWLFFFPSYLIQG